MPKLAIKKHWTTDPVTPYFSSVMPRDRFLSIVCVHVSSQEYTNRFKCAFQYRYCRHVFYF